MSSKQATEFAKLYQVALPNYHDATSDLDVTVFKDSSGNLTLGIRGTLETHDLTVTDGLIFSNGAAYDQIVALYNWWKRVSTPAGQTVTQYQLQTYSTASAPANAVQLYLPTSATGTDTYLVPATSAVATGDLVAALAADPDHKIDVTGHSLGAHLALAFNTLFPGVTGQVASFDPPGFIDNTVNQQFFAKLGGSVPTSANSGNVISVIADETNIGDKPFNAIAGLYSRPGTPVDISIENQWLSDEPIKETVKNHSMKMLTDSLAVYNLLSSLAPSLTTATYKALLNQAATGTAASYERIVDGLEATFGINTTLLPVGNDQRDALYTAIYSLQANETFTALQGKIQIVTPPADGLTAKTDFGALLSLVYLTPFALQPIDAAALTTLKNAQPTLAAQWDADQALTVEQHAQGQANFTGLYLQDRAAMLSWKTQIAIEDQADNLAPYYADTYYFKDQASGTQVWLDNPLYFNPAANDGRIQILFGESGADILVGGSRSDHLYGGLGYDALSGGAGNDYLEGNGGADVLKGEAGFDTLLGGEGNDALTGGAGNDRLEGGTGADTYQFTSGDGWDWVEDSDGAGHIEYDGLILGSTPIENKAPNVWQQTAGGKTFTYSLYTRSEGGETYPCLSILGPGGGLWVKRWQAGQLGITLPGAEPANPPASTLTLAGDLEPIVDANGATMEDSLDNLVVSGLAAPGRSDTLYDSAGNDLIQGLGGDDLLFAFRGGANMLEGGSGNDTNWRLAA